VKLSSGELHVGSKTYDGARSGSKTAVSGQADSQLGDLHYILLTSQGTETDVSMVQYITDWGRLDFV